MADLIANGHVMTGRLVGSGPSNRPSIWSWNQSIVLDLAKPQLTVLKCQNFFLHRHESQL